MALTMASAYLAKRHLSPTAPVYRVKFALDLIFRSDSNHLLAPSLRGGPAWLADEMTIPAAPDSACADNEIWRQIAFYQMADYLAWAEIHSDWPIDQLDFQNEDA